MEPRAVFLLVATFDSQAIRKDAHLSQARYYPTLTYTFIQDIEFGVYHRTNRCFENAAPKKFLAFHNIFQGDNPGTFSININPGALCQSMISYCNICGSEGKFILKDLEREGHICANCGASSRHRAVIYVLGICTGFMGLPLVGWPKKKTIRILESSGRSSYPMMLREKFEYYNTEYDPESDLTHRAFTRVADLQSLAYPDEEFDYVIATDVFEHVRNDEKAFHEVFRVLKKNGTLIMTVPYEHDWEETLTRVGTNGGKDVFLLPPEHHGGGGQTLSYRTYGRDLLDRLRSHGFSVGYWELEVPKYNIDRQPIFVAVKGSHLDLGKFHKPARPMSGWQEEMERDKTAIKASPLLLFRLFVIMKYNLLSVRHFTSEVIRKLTGKSRKPGTF